MSFKKISDLPAHLTKADESSSPIDERVNPLKLKKSESPIGMIGKKINPVNKLKKI